MTLLQSRSAHAAALLSLGLPLVGSHIAQMALHVVDTLVLGRYGVTELAAVVLGGSCFFVIFVLGGGFAQAVMPLVAHALGRGDETEVRRATRMGIWLSILFGLLIYPLFWFSEPLLLGLGQKPDVAHHAAVFLRIAGLGMIPALLVMVLKSFLAAQERTQVVLWVTVGAVGVNGLLCYPLVFGRWGLPEMGVAGSALATLIIQVLTLVIMGLYAGLMPEFRRFRLFQRFWRPDVHAMAQVFRLGAPIGLTGLAEAGLFQAAALMMGWIGTVELAAHGIAMQVTSIGFMMHMGLSNAATVRTGRFAGTGAWGDLRRGARVAIAISGAVGLVQIAIYLIWAEPIVGLFIDRSAAEAPQILVFGGVLLIYAAAFQMMDAAQVLALGLLRGVQDTAAPMLIAAVSYWLIGVPAAWYLAFRADWGGPGLWMGLVIGLACAASALMWRFWSRVPQDAPAAQVPGLR